MKPSRGLGPSSSPTLFDWTDRRLCNLGKLFHMAFPAENLVATGGELYCHVFENSLTGMPRDLYWSATLNFAPIDYCGNSLTCSATIEWLRITQRDFRQISNYRFFLDGAGSVAEASFYMSRHDNATSATVSLTYLGRRKRVKSQIGKLSRLAFDQPALTDPSRCCSPAGARRYAGGVQQPSPGSPARRRTLGNATSARAPTPTGLHIRVPPRLPVEPLWGSSVTLRSRPRVRFATLGFVV